jgi:hypothetical protein
MAKEFDHAVNLQDDATLLAAHNCWLRLQTEMINDHAVTAEDATQSMLTVAVAGRQRMVGPRATAEELRKIIVTLEALANGMQ